jgi:hypothetical protein
MALEKVRGRLAISGSLTIGGDVTLTRGAANRLDLGSGDSLTITAGTLNASAGTTLIANGTAALGTAGQVTGRIRLATQGGTPCIGFDLNGTTFYVLRGGNL